MITDRLVTTGSCDTPRSCDQDATCDVAMSDSDETFPRVATPSAVETTEFSASVEMTNSVFPNGHDYTYQLRSAPYRRLEHPADKSLFLSFLGSILFLIAALILLGPAVVVYVILLPMGFLIKRCFATCCCCSEKKTCACCLLEFMSHTDSFWLHDTGNGATVSQALFTLEKGLEIGRISELVNTKIISAETKNGHRLYPRFQQKAHKLFSGYAWITDANFSIANHVFNMPSSVVDEASLARYIADQASKPLPLTKPLWEIHIRSDYGKEENTLVLFRIHPCVSDGISLVKILFRTLVSEQLPLNLKPRFGHVAFAFNCMRAVFIAPLVFLHKWLFQWQDQNLLHGRQTSAKKTVAWSRPFSMSRATRVKQVTRSTLNDILLTVAAGVLRTYLQKHGVQHPFDLHSLIPIDFRSESTHSVQMGNQMALMDLRLPTNTEGAIPRLWEIKHRMDDLKNSADPVVLYGTTWTLAYLLPEILYRKVWARIINKSSCIVSSLQGPDLEVNVAMCNLKSLLTWMPTRDDVALSLSFVTYADQLCMTVIADSTLVPDPESLTDYFLVQMETLSELLANRRIPGEHSGRRLDGGLSDDSGGAGDETTIKDIQVKMREVQHQLQDLKSRLDVEAQEQYSSEERTLVSRVEQLKEEFRELLAELRRKKAADGSAVLSDDEDEEDGELRRSAYRKRSTSGSSRRSLSSVSTARPLTTQSSASQVQGSQTQGSSASMAASQPRPPTSPQLIDQSQGSSASLPSFDLDSMDLATPEHHGKVVVHDQNKAVEKKVSYSPQVERKF